MVYMNTHNKRKTKCYTGKKYYTSQLQRLNKRNALLIVLRKRQSELYGNIESWAEMTQPQKIKFIEKLHWEENFTLRDIANLLDRSYSWLIEFKKKNPFKVKSRVKSLLDKTGGRSINWKGGRFLYTESEKPHRQQWMIFKPEHPNANNRGYLPEHRLVMSEKLGRPLEKDEVVHHLDGNSLNNNPDNLQLMTRGGRNKFHGIPLKCPQCGYELKQDFLK